MGKDEESWETHCSYFLCCSMHRFIGFCLSMKTNSVSSPCCPLLTSWDCGQGHPWFWKWPILKIEDPLYPLMATLCPLPFLLGSKLLSAGLSGFFFLPFCRDSFSPVFLQIPVVRCIRSPGAHTGRAANSPEPLCLLSWDLSFLRIGSYCEVLLTARKAASQPYRCWGCCLTAAAVTTH